MLLEDTVHGSLDDAPLINGSLGITIRGAGLSRGTWWNVRILAAVCLTVSCAGWRTPRGLPGHGGLERSRLRRAVAP